MIASRLSFELAEGLLDILVAGVGVLVYLFQARYITLPHIAQILNGICLLNVFSDDTAEHSYRILGISETMNNELTQVDLGFAGALLAVLIIDQGHQLRVSDNVLI